MHFLLKLGGFLIFLLAYAVWLMLAGNILTASSSVKTLGKTLWIGELSALWFNAGFFAFIYLLCHFFSLPLVVLLVAGSQLGIILSAVSISLLGISVQESFQRYQWAGAEIGRVHPAFVIFAMGLPSALFLAYPFAAGWLYFSHAAFSSQLTISILSLSLVIMIFGGYLTPLSFLARQLLSKDLDENSRTLGFVNSLSQVVVFAIYATVTLLVFHVVAAGGQIDWRNLSSSRSLAAALIGVFITFLLLYVAGFARSRKWQLLLLRKQRLWIILALEALDFPMASVYLERLNWVLGRIQMELQSFVLQEKAVGYWSQLDAPAPPQSPGASNAAPQLSSQAAPSLPAAPLEQHGLTRWLSSWSRFQSKVEGEIAESYRATRWLDPRFAYLDFLTDLSQKIQAVGQDLAAKTSEADRMQAAKTWGDAFRYREGLLAKEVDTWMQTKPPLWVLAGALLTPFLSGVIGELAKNAAALLPHGAGVHVP